MPLQKQMERQKKKLAELEQTVRDRDRQLTNEALALQAFGCIIQHMDQNLNAFDMPRVQLQLKQNDKRHEQLQTLIEQFKSDLMFEQTERERERCEAGEEAERAAIELRTEQQRHQKEREKLLEMFECEAQSTEKLHQNQLKEAQSEIQHLKSELDRQKNVAIEQDRLLVEARERAEVAEKNLTADKDRKVRVLGEKNQFLRQEVESLRTVLELREQDLRTAHQKLQIQLVEQEQIQPLKQQLQTVLQQQEQLEIALKLKGDALRTTEQELLDLREKLSEQAKESTELSRKNEELEFVLNESIGQSIDESSPNALRRYSLARCWTERPVRVSSVSLSDKSYGPMSKSVQRPLSYAAGERYSIGSDSYGFEDSASLERAGRLKRKKCLQKEFETARDLNELNAQNRQLQRDSLGDFLMENQSIDGSALDSDSSCFESNVASAFESENTLNKTVILTQIGNLPNTCSSPNDLNSPQQTECSLNTTFDIGHNEMTGNVSVSNTSADISMIQDQSPLSLTVIIQPTISTDDGDSGQCFCPHSHNGNCCSSVGPVVNSAPSSSASVTATMNDNNNNPSNNSMTKSSHLQTVQLANQSILDSGFGDL